MAKPKYKAKIKGENEFEIFEEVEREKVDNGIVKVFQPIETVFISDLEMRKEHILNELNDVQEKIDAINRLN